MTTPSPRLPLLLLILPIANAFVTPTVFYVKKSQLSASALEDLASALIVADGDDFVQTVDGGFNDAVTSGAGGSILNILQNVASVFIIGTVFLFGLTFMVANFVIPAAARELEEQTRKLDVNLWNEYQAKLEPGETIDQRPELMQELGNKVQQMMKEQYDTEVAQVKEESEKTMVQEKKPSSDVMDATIISKESDDQWK